MNYEYNPHKAAKNLLKHRVSFDEAVTVFFDPLRITANDEEHSLDEQRFITIGQSTRGRILFVIYTETEIELRLISARVATKAERKQYEEIN